jgi:hypothetical protein
LGKAFGWLTCTPTPPEARGFFYAVVRSHLSRKPLPKNPKAFPKPKLLRRKAPSPCFLWPSRGQCPLSVFFGCGVLRWPSPFGHVMASDVAFLAISWPKGCLRPFTHRSPKSWEVGGLGGKWGNYPRHWGNPRTRCDRSCATCATLRHLPIATWRTHKPLSPNELWGLAPGAPAPRHFFLVFFFFSPPHPSPFSLFYTT